MRLLFIFLLVFGLANYADADTVPKPLVKSIIPKKPAVLKLDSSKVETRKFSQQAIKEYSTQRDFIYDDAAPKGLSWWGRFWRWIGYILDQIFGGKSTSDGGFTKVLFIILRWVLTALLVAAIGFIIIKIFGLDLRLLTGKSKAIDVPYEESLENIHEINFDDQIENALQNGNYRLAVRLLYLKTLKNLSDKQLINWQLEKTNQAYVAEIENPTYKQEFNKLTNQFEYIWYGEFFIDKNSFEPINQSFSQFNQQTA